MLILTSNYNKRNIVQVNDYVNTNFTGSKFFDKLAKSLFIGNKCDLSQNVQTKYMQLTLPNINFNISQFYPLRRRIVVGKLRWYENISMSYNVIAVNSMGLYDSILLSQQIPNNMRYGISQAIPISSTVKIFKYLDWNNSIRMNEYWQFRGVMRTWERDTNGKAKINRDTVYNFFATHHVSYISTLKTTLYGMYSMKKGKVQAFRHEFIPSLSFSYIPAINKSHFKSYYDSIENKTRTYSPTEGFLFSKPLEKQLADISLMFEIG